MRDIETTDIVLAAYLKLCGCALSSIEMDDKKKGIFCFTNVDEKVLIDYDLGQAQVEPIAFNNIIRTLTRATRRLM